jgi:hypothetical protein
MVRLLVHTTMSRDSMLSSASQESMRVLFILTNVCENKKYCFVGFEQEVADVCMVGKLV